jgi:hypothetical protein
LFVFNVYPDVHVVQIFIVLEEHCAQFATWQVKQVPLSNGFKLNGGKQVWQVLPLFIHDLHGYWQPVNVHVFVDKFNV